VSDSFSDIELECQGHLRGSANGKHHAPWGKQLEADVADALAWLHQYRATIDCTVERIPFAESSQWRFDEDTLDLRHDSGKFFSIQGYARQTADGRSVQQPLINQPELGTQGFIVRHNGAEYELLVQARTEPGNIDMVQMGPTIQATYSNYTTVHGGKRPKFLEHFHEPEKHDARVIVDTIQPELGSKFLRKWNRNIVIEVDDLPEFADPMFHWVSWSALSRLMLQDHVVNNDARLTAGLFALEMGNQLFPTDRSCDIGRANGNGSNSAGCPVGRSFATDASFSFADAVEIRPWLNAQRRSDTQEVTELPLKDLSEWEVGDDEIRHRDGLFFSVIQVRVHAADREVTDWDQPLIMAKHLAAVTLVCRERNGVLNFLLRAASQIGNASGAELQPTVCFDNERAGEEDNLPQAVAELLQETNCKEHWRFLASDEGGRFYRCVSRYEIIWLDDAVEVALPDDYCWLTLAQIRKAMQEPDFVSDESRSVLSLFLAKAFNERLTANGRMTGQAAAPPPRLT